MLSRFGPKSDQVGSFREKNKNNKDLLKLCDAVVALQVRLKAGALPVDAAEKAGRHIA
jgi:hypothetical protein